MGHRRWEALQHRKEWWNAVLPVSPTCLRAKRLVRELLGPRPCSPPSRASPCPPPSPPALRPQAEFNAPCRTTKYPREIPPLPWYRQTVPQMLMAGFLPFSAIYIELCEPHPPA